MQRLLMIALAVSVVAAFAMPAVALKAPDTITLEVSGQAPVLFNHAAHSALAKGCKDCHHYGVGNGSCSGCHGKTDQAPSLAEAYAKCTTCHTSAPAPMSAPAASCSDYSDKGSCDADTDCRWSRYRGKCRDAR